MSSYTAPLSDLRFALHDVLKVEPLFARLGFTDATADVVDAVLEEAGRFSASRPASNRPTTSSSMAAGPA